MARGIVHKMAMLVLIASCSDARSPQIDGSIPRHDASVDAKPEADAALPVQTSRLRVINRCERPIVVASSHFADVPLAAGAFHDYEVPDAGLASTRFWARISAGLPPIDSKLEVTFAPIGGADPTYYNLSFVDGYTFPIAVEGCFPSDCSALSLDDCPDELRIDEGCMSPCQQWTYPAPYGQGRPESQEPGRHYCCPAGVTPEECRDASDPRSVVNTEYVALIHERCPTAYAYSYDDSAGLHTCPPDARFVLAFCP